MQFKTKAQQIETFSSVPFIPFKNALPFAGTLLLSNSSWSTVTYT
jgi:hypothetical protein